MELHAGTITLRVDSLATRVLDFSPVPPQAVVIRFGYEPLQREGALFALRDVRIFKQTGGASPLPVHWWPLDEVEGPDAHDRVGSLTGRQSQGKWMLPFHSMWRLDREFGPIADSTAFLVYDQMRERFLLVTRDTLFFISGHDSSIEREAFASPHVGRYHKLLYDARRNRLFTFHEGGGRVTEYSFRNRTWPAVDSSTEYNQQNYTSATWIDPVSGDLWMFGGYGWYTLKNTFYRYDFVGRRWAPIAVHGDTIPPRMGPAVAVDETGRVYIAGGMGNLTGKQEAGLHQFFDLWQFDPDERTVRKLWASRDYLGDGLEKVVLVPADSTLFFLARKYSNEEGSEVHDFTLIAYPSLQKLAALRLPPQLLRTRLFVDEQQAQIILAFEFLNARKEYSFKVYTLDYPPVPGGRHLVAGGTTIARRPDLIVGLGVAAGVLVVGWVYWRRTRKRSLADPGGAKSIPGTSGLQKPQVSIEVLGRFRVLDAQANDLVPLMRRQVAQVFMVLLIHSLPGRGGIDAEKLTMLFWPNVDPRSARNSRNVAIKHLRDVLLKAGVSVLFNDDIYSLKFPDHFDCDYYRLVDAAERIKENTAEIPDALLRDFLAKAGKGQLLPGKDYEWLEGFRTDLMSDVTRAAGVLLTEKKSGISADRSLEVADVALLWDPLNEAAMRAKLRRLITDGLHSEARAEFDRFAEYYQSTFQHPFPDTIQAFLRG
jgi:DNA-binding SARP family transcriptional activator